MATVAHVLRYTDIAWREFLISDAGISGLTSDQIVRTKESADKDLPILICNAENAVRKRAKNWEVTGSLLLKTACTDTDGQVTAAALTTSDDLETALLEKIENVIPIDDRPQPLADAITAAAVVSAIASTRFMMTACVINRVTSGFDEDELWTFSVDYTATVIA
jgi:hypothetical protein